MQNPVGKGVLFDTGRSYDEYAILDMFSQNRLIGYGSAKYYVRYIHRGDLVFFSHKWCGLVAAACVTVIPSSRSDLVSRSSLSNQKAHSARSSTLYATGQGGSVFG